MKAPVRAALACLVSAALSSPCPAAGPDAALPARAQAVLQTYCYRCHGQDGANEGGFNYVLDRDRLVGRHKIVPGKPARSRLYKRLTDPDSPMPPEEQKLRPNKAEIALLRRWIETGAPTFAAAVAKRRFITAAGVISSIQADLARVPERARRFTRYFTLTHLYNAGLAADELQSYRHGLSKLVNSLSWGGKIVVPRAIDPERTVFRIDLRDYQWNEKVWDAVLAANPYGVAADTDAARAVAEATHCRVPFVRADWFVAAASRPPLYHEVLQLPATDAELEKLLRVDVAEDIRQERVARAGFNSSGVSRNNRLIERHESGSVVYWKSYDFGSNVGRQNLFSHPLGPGDAEGSFRQDGGEIIFNLPNGLQGYMLVNGRGERIDKGPTAIVSDPKRPDRAVENGLSCMSCHARGMIEKADQVRAHVEKNRNVFPEADRDTILALYPPRERFAELLRKDARRFQEAVAKTGAPLTATEPVAALALRFEAEMDLPLVAAEAGVQPGDLLRVIDRSRLLARQLGALRVEGGTVQRQVFVDVFPELNEQLRLGEFLPPRSLAYVRLLGRADRLLRQHEVGGAVRAYGEAVALEPRNPLAYIGRGDAYREQPDYPRAVADYTEALRLDPQSALARNNRGLAYDRKGDHEQALTDFTEALRLNPRFAAAYHNRAAVHLRRGEFDRAIADDSEALRLDPESAPAYINRGLAYQQKGDTDRALADLNEALRLNPRSAVAYNNRGLVHHDKGDEDKAIADFSEAIRLDPNFARAYLNRGIAREAKGDQAGAEADRRKALQLDSSLDKD